MERLTILTLIRWAKENGCEFHECEDCFIIYAHYSKAKKLMAFVKKNGIDSLFRFVEWSKVHAFVRFANYYSKQNMNFKFTNGPWGRNVPPATKYPTIFAGINTHIARVVVDGISPEEVDANASLIATAPEMLEALQKAKATISRLKLSIAVHPDCEPGSEFGDRVNSAQAVEDEIEALIKKATTI